MANNQLSKDFNTLSPEKLLAEYYSATESDLDDEDINYMIEDRFGYDPDFDEEKDIKNLPLTSGVHTTVLSSLPSFQ